MRHTAKELEAFIGGRTSIEEVTSLQGFKFCHNKETK